MTTIDTPPVRTWAPSGSYRPAGIASLVLAAAFLAQFALLLLSFGSDDPDETLGAFLDRTHVSGIVEGAAWIAAGIATVVITAAADRLWSTSDSLVRVLARFFGYSGAVGFLLAGGIGLAGVGYAGQLLEQVPGGADAGWVGYQAANGVLWTAVRLVACIGEAGWLVLLATSGRRAGIIGVPLSVLGFVAAAIILLPSAAFGELTTQLFVVPAFLVFGIAFLLRGRRPVA